MSNSNLHAAKKAKNDEFYTRLADIENELKHYKPFFKGKTVLLNCGDAPHRNFWKYFAMNFEHLGLKKLIGTSFTFEGQGTVSVYEGDRNGNRNPDDEEIVTRPLQGNGDFRSEECIGLLKEADVVVGNPPFSLFREYVAQLMEYGKKFLIIGNKNALTYKEVFPLIKENKLWVGVTPMSQDMKFIVPDEYAEEVVKTKKEGSAYVIRDGQVLCRAQAIWFTNIPHAPAGKPLILEKRYSPEDYPKYDNYDAIEVSRVADIPVDYDGVIGVPVTFLDKYNSEQFDIVGFRYGDDGKNLCINGKYPYSRILIRRKDQLEPADFEIVGATESEGTGFSNGVFSGGNTKQALVDGNRIYKRILIRRK